MMLLARSLRSSLRPPLASAAAAFSSASAAAAEAERAIRDGPRNDWSRPEIQAVYDSPLLDLLFHGVRTPSWAEHSRSQNPAVNPLVVLVFGTGLVVAPEILRKILSLSFRALKAIDLLLRCTFTFLWAVKAGFGVSEVKPSFSQMLAKCNFCCCLSGGWRSGDCYIVAAWV
jgi:hypothetical protein